MSWIPAFKPGLWNAWILMLIAMLPTLIMSYWVDAELFIKKMGDAPTEKREKIGNFITTAILLLLVACSILLPLKLGTAWFYAGLATWLVGMATFLTSIVNVTQTPIGQVFKRGMYRYSRHPLYVSMALILVGIGLAAASWIFLLLAAAYIILQNSFAAAEERECLETFGEEYRDYMNKTPRWLGLPK